MLNCHQKMRVTRADYEANFGVRPDPYSIGACFYASDGKTILIEYIFMDEKEEVAILEELYVA